MKIKGILRNIYQGSNGERVSTVLNVAMELPKSAKIIQGLVTFAVTPNLPQLTLFFIK